MSSAAAHLTSVRSPIVLRAAPDPEPPLDPWSQAVDPPDPPTLTAIDLHLADQLTLDLPLPAEQPAEPEEPELAQLAQLAVWRLLGAVLEVLDGRRPLRQLRGLLSGQVHAALQTRTQHRQPGAREVRRLRSVRICRPAPGVVEASATLGTAHRVQAAALRLEAVHPATDGNPWRCTALRLI